MYGYSIEGKKSGARKRNCLLEKGFLRHKRGEVDKEDTFWISGGSSIIRRDYTKNWRNDEIYNLFIGKI